MAAPSPTQKLSIISGNFFSVNTVEVESLFGADEQKASAAAEEIAVVSQVTNIRGAQFKCGSILLKDDDIFAGDAVMSEEFAREHGIHHAYGRGNWNLILFCPERSIEQRRATMLVLIEKIPPLLQQTAQLRKKLAAA